jgi:excisionase family DNA binding protein
MLSSAVIHCRAVSTVAIADLIEEPELAEMLRVSVVTLRRWAAKGEGPKRVRIGRRICYRRATVERWLAAKERRAG